MQDHLSAIKRLIGMVAVTIAIVGAMGTAASFQADSRIVTQHVATAGANRG